MSSVLIMKGQTGKLEGFGEKGAKVYAKFLKAVRELEVGELISFSYRVPRAPKFHRLHFAMLKAVHDNQEQFADAEQFRKWCEVGAGHAEFVPGPNGKMVALPKSIAYDALDDAEFSDVHEAVKRFLRSETALRFLWPHVKSDIAAESINGLLEEFER